MADKKGTGKGAKSAPQAAGGNKKAGGATTGRVKPGGKKS